MMVIVRTEAEDRHHVPSPFHSKDILPSVGDVFKHKDQWYEVIKRIYETNVQVSSISQLAMEYLTITIIVKEVDNPL